MKSIAVATKNLNLTADRGYQCVLEDSDGVVSPSIASFMNDSEDMMNITCSGRTYSYDGYTKEKTANLRLKWNGTDVFLDGSVNVTLYKCGVERPDCSRCLSNHTTRTELNCRWCNSSQSCVHESKCDKTNEVDECTAGPVVTSVSPSNGTLEGGTLVQINGIDLGLRFEDIDGITLGGIECVHENHSESYKHGASVSCISGRSNITGEFAVIVTVRNMSSKVNVNFSYKNASIDSFSPTFGPESGGTVINITGSDFKIGRNVSVELGTGICDITFISENSIICVNRASSANSSSALVISFDGSPRMAPDNFTFHPNPTVGDIDPKSAIRSGGNKLTVTGTGFEVIQRPRIVFTYKGNQSKEECIIESGEKMFCTSPPVMISGRRRRDAVPIAEVDVGFIMDNVTDLLDWSRKSWVNRRFEVMVDPDYQKFPGEDNTRVYYSFENFKTFYLNGTNLKAGSQSVDVKVYIGNESCSDVSLAPTKLTCSPKSGSTPPPLFRNGSKTDRDLAFVEVHHANLVFEIGYVRFIDYFDYIIYAAGGIIVLLLLIVLCSLCCVWRIRSQKAAKIHDLELQVLEIQDSVSGKLKSLFATLQTTAENFDVTLSQIKTIPLLNKRQYLLNMLFLGLRSEPSSEPTQDVLGNPNIKSAMSRFSVNLLSKKDFLAVLIKALDQNMNIGSMEKVNIASLLSVCLLQDGKQELLTSVMISLMREQIQDCDPKAAKYRIIFSRSETVLEKLLSNWITIFQYQHLKDHAAKPLHHLYHAVKHVCEMGPIDAITGKSQFSINDQQMLETQIPFNELSLSIIVNSVTGEKETISALDVNTVTQVKQRIISHLYKNVPYSKQPDPYMYDLMWRTGRGGQLILRDDDDLSGNTDKNWKKLNTLGDFNVTSGVACFELVEKQANPNTTLDVPSSSGVKKPGAEGAAASKTRNQKYQAMVSRHSSFRAGSLPVGMKPWHLVKEEEPEDEEEEEEGSKIKHKEIKEVVLPFLPATRNYIQKYVESFLDAVLTDESDGISPSIRCLFQFFDREADKLEKPEYAKAWKDNVFALRFWATVLANPQYALDLGIHSYTSACLRILVQVVKDTCAGRSKPNKTDYSPSRLLYSSYIPGYITKLAGFHDHVKGLGRVSAADMAQECTQVQLDFERCFDLVSTQYELYKILEEHKDMLMAALDDDDICNEADMAGEMQSISQEITG